MSRYLVPLIAFAILIPVFVIGLGKDPSHLPSPLLQKPAPQFELPSLTDPGKNVGSASFENQMAILNVWATWCVGCRQEHGFLMQLAQSGAIPIYGLNWRDNRTEAQRFLQQLGNPYVDSAYDEDGRVGIDWGVYGAPETFLVAADGTVLYKHLGPLNPDLWEQNFVPLIDAARHTQ
ncbi:MAG: DsbE family thiol:disulfide interchange protein [Gammaproteobacteria bacterium]|nr:DsbE family thiol:disulfide interchange protein [Gammaproteobacteria bacterium]MDH3431258.1 DsbE family thiol:disulfide interchange protein [Gammaproteobacteria bacterium]MDH3435148.1 DsbE family thiol:disulfide interchange protein [Gammaproteobacteria bacterium]